jgi:hypothetical protein
VLRLISISDGRIYKDITYLIVPNMSWTIIEPALYVIAATIPTLRPLVQYLSGKTSKSLTKGASRMSFPRQSLGFNTLDAKISHPTRVLRKKSSQSLYLHLAETVGRRLSKIMPVDGRNDMQEHSLMTFRSMDEESLVCADAVTHERYAKEGRNPDGTLRTWSLMQPVPLSPLRTSFFLEDLKVPTPVQIARRSIEAAMIPRYWTSGCNSPRYSKSMQTITTPVAAEQLPRSERRQ